MTLKGLHVVEKLLVGLGRREHVVYLKGIAYLQRISLRCLTSIHGIILKVRKLFVENCGETKIDAIFSLPLVLVTINSRSVASIQRIFI